MHGFSKSTEVLRRGSSAQPGHLGAATSIEAGWSRWKAVHVCCEGDVNQERRALLGPPHLGEGTNKKSMGRK